jgi:cytosine/adenosine deaminase-related metal-dependent hydrolase
MRKLSANYIYTNKNLPLKNGIIEVDESGIITNVIDTNGDLKETANIEFYNGVIVPGFINSHCHLELSYLKNIIPQNTGHETFIKKIVENINTIKPNLQEIYNADNEMYNDGIVAVADISNNIKTAEIKNKSKIYYHTFIEFADFFDEKIAENRLFDFDILKDFFENNSLVAHSPYTSSVDFIKKTANYSKSIYSIHNQEADSENEMYQNSTGKVFDLMKERKLIGNFKVTGKTSLQSYLSEIVRENLNILLIHNIFTSEKDIEYAEKNSKNIFWVMCPNSNSYIQKIKPNIQKFVKNNCKITLGTDSLATNKRLSIIEEMKNFRDIPFDEVLKWATINGAKALKIEKQFGSIEKGKKCGLNLIENFDFDKMHINENSNVRKLY